MFWNHFNNLILKKIFCVLIIILSHRQFLGQTNLVPNWSFETYTSCPIGSGQLALATFWQCAGACGEYYNSCATYPYSTPNYDNCYQIPKDGNGFIALQTYDGSNYREYARVKLIDSLKNNYCYYIEFFVNETCGMHFATNNMAASLSKKTYSSAGLPLNLPQHITKFGNPIIYDTLNWVQVAGIYNATGHEQYLTIGNMKDDANTDTTSANMGNGYPGTYYLIDAVSLYQINPSAQLPWTYQDTTVNFGDSVYIGNYLGGNFTSNWYLQGGGFINSRPGIYVKPNVTSNYIVQFNLCGVQISDTVTVTVIHSSGINGREIKNSEFLINPNPNNGLIDIEILNKDFILHNSTIKIFNVFGQEIKRLELLNKKQEIELQDLKSGIYYLQLLQGNKVLISKKIIKL